MSLEDQVTLLKKSNSFRFKTSKKVHLKLENNTILYSKIGIDDYSNIPLSEGTKIKKSNDRSFSIHNSKGVFELHFNDTTRSQIWLDTILKILKKDQPDKSPRKDSSCVTNVQSTSSPNVSLKLTVASESLKVSVGSNNESVGPELTSSNDSFIKSSTAPLIIQDNGEIKLQNRPVPPPRPKDLNLRLNLNSNKPPPKVNPKLPLSMLKNRNVSHSISNGTGKREAYKSRTFSNSPKFSLTGKKSPSYFNGNPPPLPQTNRKIGNLQPSLSVNNGPQQSPSIDSLKNPDNYVNHQQRKKVAREIYDTEVTYVNNLEILLKYYMEPLRQNISQLNLTLEQVNSIFPKNLESIYKFNCEFCNQLEKDIIVNDDTSNVGKTFVKYGSFLKMYNLYSSDYQNALNSFNKLLKENSLFAAELEKCRQNSLVRLTFSDFIIMPVQRVPRYSLLLLDLLKHTPKSSDDYASIEEALSLMTEIGSYINEFVMKSDNSKRLAELSAKGANIEKLLTPQRFLIREGILKVYEKGKKETKHYFLFNDVIVTVKEALLKAGADLSLPEYMWPLNLVWIKEVDDKIEIIGPNDQKMSVKLSKIDPNWLKELKERSKMWIELYCKRINKPVQENIRYGEYTSPTGETYNGEWLDGFKHGTGICVYMGCTYEGNYIYGRKEGFGKLKYATGEVYSGEWKNDVQIGNGELIDSNGDVIYSGNWSDGLFHGQGKIKYKNSDKYEGEFEGGVISGEGTFISSSGLVYKGQWKSYLFEGRGMIKYPDGTVYEGLFKNGMKNGKGHCVYSNGDEYYGQWVDDMKHGGGEYKYSDSSCYDGEWEFDLPEGKGDKTWPDGTHYSGSWSKGLRKGNGTCNYPNKSKYIGSWLDDLRHGYGTFMESDGSTYVGEWANDKKEGKGIMTYTNMARYDGQWQNDKYHKFGTYYGSENDDIKLYEGEWNLGQMYGKGTLTFKNGDVYKGGFKNGKFHGNGMYIYSNGVVLNGKWNMGLREGKFSLVSSNDKKEVTVGNSDNSNSPTISTSYVSPHLPPLALSVSVYECKPL